MPPFLTLVVNPLQKAIREKEFELVTIKNQKLESLCRALQEERKSLYEKVQGAGPQPDGTNTHEPSEVEDFEGKETPKAPKDDHPLPNDVALVATPTLDSPLTKELAKVKAEQARLKEIVSSFTIAHSVSTETVVAQSQGLSEGVQEPGESHTKESNGEQIQEVMADGYQGQSDLEMESVD